MRVLGQTGNTAAGSELDDVREDDEILLNLEHQTF